MITLFGLASGPKIFRMFPGRTCKYTRTDGALHVVLVRNATYPGMVFPHVAAFLHDGVNGRIPHNRSCRQNHDQYFKIFRLFGLFCFKRDRLSFAPHAHSIPYRRSRGMGHTHTATCDAHEIKPGANGAAKKA